MSLNNLGRVRGRNDGLHRGIPHGDSIPPMGTNQNTPHKSPSVAPPLTQPFAKTELLSSDTEREAR